MSDILKKFPAVRAQEIATAHVNKPVAAIRAEATSKQHQRVICVGAIRATIFALTKSRSATRDMVPPVLALPWHLAKVAKCGPSGSAQQAGPDRLADKVAIPRQNAGHGGFSAYGPCNAETIR